MSDNEWWDRLQAKYAASNERLESLPENSFEYISGGSKYAQKTALYRFNNAEAANPNIISDFDLMVMYDGNPCFGGSVTRLPRTGEAPFGSVRITVYTD